MLEIDYNSTTIFKPPLGHMDLFKEAQHWGCADLLDAIEKRVKPKLHVFGHVHEKNGMNILLCFKTQLIT